MKTIIFGNFTLVLLTISVTYSREDTDFAYSRVEESGPRGFCQMRFCWVILETFTSDWAAFLFEILVHSPVHRSKIPHTMVEIQRLRLKISRI